MTNNQLYHHGIRGQKWGVRNGPPYPLGKVELYGKKDNVNLPDTINRVMNNKINDINPNIIKRGAKAVPTLLMTIKAIKNVKKKKIIGHHSQDQDMEAVNHDREKETNKEHEKYDKNCSICSAIYELRRRGYNVKAIKSDVGTRIDTFSSWFGIKKKDVRSFKKYKDFITALNKQKEGSRGAIFVGVGQFDSNHSMVWEKNNGKIILRDIQRNRLHVLSESDIINKESKRPYSFIRTDNAKINWKKIIDVIQKEE